MSNPQEHLEDSDSDLTGPPFGLLLPTQPTVVIPPNARFIPPFSFAVTFDPFARAGNDQWLPPGASESHPFQIFHYDFLNIIGSSPRLRVIASNPLYNFAHGAAIWLSHSNEVLFCSNAGKPGPEGGSGLERTNDVFKISIGDVGSSDRQNIAVTKLDIQPPLENTNGGTTYDKNSVIFATQGRKSTGGGIFRVFTHGSPWISEGVVNNLYGRQFNSPNDVVVHPADRAIFFTDPTYGFTQGFRPSPGLPEQVYRLDFKTRAIRVVADGFGHVNGIALSPDGKKAYISDTSQIRDHTNTRYYTNPATIYEYDVLFNAAGQTKSLGSKRVFAYVDTGVPDGLKVDRHGNVYAGAGDGIHVWDLDGTHLGKITTGGQCGKFVFAGPGKIIILAEKRVYLAEISQDIAGVLP